jgi:hypothetical protein
MNTYKKVNKLGPRESFKINTRTRHELPRSKPVLKIEKNGGKMGKILKPSFRFGGFMTPIHCSIPMEGSNSEKFWNDDSNISHNTQTSSPNQFFLD